MAQLLTLLYPIATDADAANPTCTGPPHPVSVAEYKRVLDPHHITLVGEPTRSPLSVERRRDVEMYAFWNYSLEYSEEGLPGETAALADGEMFFVYTD